MNSSAPTMVITGGGSGLGKAMALHFAGAGYQVAVTDRVLGRADEVVLQIRNDGGQAFSQEMDVRSGHDWDALYQRVLTEWGRLDLLVNNAGVAGAGRLEDSSLEDWQWILDINLMGVIRGCHRFLPMMREQGSGHIVNTASFAGLIPVPAMAAYGTAKAGVVALSEQLRVDLDSSGVGVTVLCPAFVKTRLLENFRSSDPRSRSMAQKWMDNSSVSADDVAERVLQAVQKRRFMVLTHAETRWAWRVRRWFPNRFHRTMVAMAHRAERKMQ